MAKYRVLVSDASTGIPKAELPLTGLTFSRVLSGVGSLSGSLSIHHPAATEDNLGQLRTDPDREISVFRHDGTTEQAVWNGPLSGTDCTFGDGVINIVAREATWYYGKRVLEVDKDYNGSDVFDAVRSLDTYMTSKLSTGTDGTLPSGTDIIAALPRWSVAAGLSGATFTFASTPTFLGSARHTIAECLDALAADPETGFEYAMDYTTGSSRQAVHRTLNLGYPNLGSTFSGELTQRVLTNFARHLDWEPAATRVHVMAGSTPKTLQSSLAVTNSVLLLESVSDYGDHPQADLVTARARDLRRLSRPAPRTFTASFKPCQALPYGFVDLGDTVPWEVTAPDILSITSNSRRIIQIDVTADDGSEEVLLTQNDPLTDLAA